MNATFSSLAGALGSIAPTLATMLGGPLAGTAVTALEGALGLKTGSGPDAVASVIQSAAMTPEQLVAIKAADNSHAEKMKSLDIDLATLNANTQTALVVSDAGDRNSARLREATVHDNTPKIIAYVVVLLVIALEGSMFFLGQPSQVDPVILGRILGTLDSALIMVLAYYFGSSSGAARGQELLAQSGAPTAPISVTAK